MHAVRVLTLSLTAATLAALGVAPAQAATASKVTASPSRTVAAAGQGLSMSGSVTPGTYRKVAVQVWRAGAWRTVARGAEKSSGRYTVAVPGQGVGTHLLRTYAYASKGRAAKASSPVKLTVRQASFTAFTAPQYATTSPTTHTVQLSGTGKVAYAPSGATALMQRYSAGKWKAVSAPVKVVNGAFTVRSTPVAIGQHKVRAVVTDRYGKALTNGPMRITQVRPKLGYELPTLSIEGATCSSFYTDENGWTTYTGTLKVRASGGRYFDWGPDAYSEGTVVDGGVRHFTVDFDGVENDPTSLPYSGTWNIAEIAYNGDMPAPIDYTISGTVDLTKYCALTVQ